MRNVGKTDKVAKEEPDLQEKSDDMDAAQTAQKVKAVSPDDKRNALLGAAGKPQVGRRETPRPDEGLAQKRKAVITRSIIVCAVAIFVLAIVFVAIGQNMAGSI
jgi:hypothetical protein